MKNPVPYARRPAPAVLHIGYSAIQSGPATDGRPDLIAAYQSTGRFVAVTESEARK